MYTYICLCFHLKVKMTWRPALIEKWIWLGTDLVCKEGMPRSIGCYVRNGWHTDGRRRVSDLGSVAPGSILTFAPHRWGFDTLLPKGDRAASWVILGPHSTKVAVRKLELKIEYVSTEKMGLLHFSHSASAGHKGTPRPDCTCKAIPMTKGIDEMQPNTEWALQSEIKRNSVF